MAGEAGKYYDRLVKGDGVPCIMARHMYDMGLILVRLNDYDNNNETAIECLSFAEELYMDQYGEENIELIHVRKQLANVLIDEGRYDEAFPLLYKAIAQAEVFLGHDHSEQVISYYFYGFGLYKAGRVEEARKQLGESERIRKKLHTYDINGLLMLALMDYMSGDFEKACSQGWELFNVEKEYLREITLALPESDRESSWMQHGAQVMGAVFTLAAYAPEGGPLLYDAALFAKGTLMSAASRLNSIIERDGTGRLAALRDEYRTLYFQAEALSAGGEKTEGEFDELRRKARLLETDLVSHSSVFGDILSEVSATWEDVSKCLAPKEAAVEFVRFNSMRGKYVYMASVLLPGRKPVNVELPDLSDALLQKASGGSAFTSPELFKAVFGPIMPYVRDCGRVWFSPTGEMSVVPLENIRSTEGEKTASEVLPLRRLSSTRVLLQTDGARRWENAVLFGGLDYNISAEEKEYYAEASSSGVRSKSLHDWGYLRGSLSEVESIAGILSGIDVVKVTGGDGVEERFKALSGKGVNLLHVATHGFYSEDVAREVFNAGFALEDVLMGSCGLVFAGANTLNGGNANLDNGLLSATEISRLDLSGCDLVVLSACGTGLGAVNFDESYGLVRAFKKAGCRSILMSLWDIDDKATAVFMQAFYSARTGGKDNGAALEEAKAVVRKAFPDPKYWAGFVLID